ncbi:MAG: FMN-binding negative transcriptional regulator [Chloroflexota bacterium]|nr:FMN-binding negative transcriptional regulator [Chloroflexota bacterium]
MYIPRHNRVEDDEPLFALMERFSFATLVTVQDGAPLATHLPFVLDRARGEHGTILGHMARGNGQWRSFTAEAEALVIFQAEHAYISPSWYEHHPSVPTWNYMVVHAHGTPRIVDAHDRITTSLRQLVEQHERGFTEPWDMDALPDDYVAKMVRGIVAFEIPITRLAGKFKLSQNRSVADRQRVVEALAGSGDAVDRGLADAMLRDLAAARNHD